MNMAHHKSSFTEMSSILFPVRAASITRWNSSGDSARRSRRLLPRAFRLLAASGLALHVAVWTQVSHCPTARAETLSGKVVWTDAAGGTHAARQIRVDLIANGTRLIKSVYTDLEGNYTGDYTLLPGEEMVGAHAFADTPFTQPVGGGAGGGYVSSDGTASKIHQWKQGLPPPATGGTLNITIPNELPGFPAATASARAFSIADAVHTGAFYSGGMRGTAAPKVGVAFPFDETAYSSSTGRLLIESEDWDDWDVILHEYGHYLSHKDQMDLSDGGPHALGVSNITGGMFGGTPIPARGKSNGVRIAWGEGLATYMGIAAQHYDPLSQKLPTTMAGVGDTRSQNGSLWFDLESHAEDWGGATEHGEGDELPIARILWDLADPANEPHDRISPGHSHLYQTLDTMTVGAGGVAEIDNVWDHYTSVGNDAGRKDYGAIFEEYGISPHPTNDPNNPQSRTNLESPPTFEWLRGNNDENDKFQLIFFKSDMSSRVLSVENLDPAFTYPGQPVSYTLTEPQWTTLRGTIGTYKFVVAGEDTRSLGGAADWYTTGAYWSDAYSFTVVKDPRLGGDLNGNGFVGQDDLNSVLANWGQNVTPGDWLSGDPSGDGFVGQDDLNPVLGNWGQSAPPAALSLVPEQQSLLLLVIGIAGLLPICRQKRQRVSARSLLNA